MSGQPLNVWDYERVAEAKLDANAHAYFAGGAGDEVTLRDNLAAFERRKLRPRILVDVRSVTTATTVLGTEISLPIVIAPLALQRMAHEDGELATARAAAAAGTIMCLSSAATSSPAEVAAVAPDAPHWFQVYVWRSRSITEAAIDEAVASGYSALVLTVDVPYLGRRERDLRIDFKVPEHLTVQGDLFAENFDRRRQLARSRVARGLRPPGRREGDPHGGGRETRLRARCSRSGRLQPRRAVNSTVSPRASTHSRKSSRPSRGARRCSSTAASAAAPTH